MSAVSFTAPFTNFRYGIKDGGAVLFTIATRNYVPATRDSGMSRLDTRKRKASTRKHVVTVLYYFSLLIPVR